MKCYLFFILNKLKSLVRDISYEDKVVLPNRTYNIDWSMCLGYFHTNNAIKTTYLQLNAKYKLKCIRNNLTLI